MGGREVSFYRAGPRLSPLPHMCLPRAANTCALLTRNANTNTIRNANAIRNANTICNTNSIRNANTIRMNEDKNPNENHGDRVSAG
jgi:hypothetical protein